MEQAVRWNIRVSQETATTLTTYLDSAGLKRGSRSRFIEEAVRTHLFHQTVQHIKARNAETDSEELQLLIDQTVREVRADRRRKATTETA